eukprot:1653891-Amphidinium_carterae.1
MPGLTPKGCWITRLTMGHNVWLRRLPGSSLSTVLHRGRLPSPSRATSKCTQRADRCEQAGGLPKYTEKGRGGEQGPVRPPSGVHAAVNAAVHLPSALHSMGRPQGVTAISGVNSLG